jgi:hypothetical protein
MEYKMLFGHLEGKQGSHLGGSISRKGRFKPLLAGK